MFLLVCHYALAVELKPVSLQLLWKHQFQFAGYYIAKEKGFYKEAGLDVTIKEFTNNINVAQEVIKQNADFGVGRSSLIINRSQGDNIVLLASILQSSPHVFLAMKNSGIKTISDFKNKRVMLSGNEKNEITLRSMIFSKGIQLNDFTLQKHTFNINDLINNNTDLMSAYISNEPYALKEKGFEGIIFDPKDYGFDFYNDLLFTSNQFLSANPALVKKFVNASLKGWAYAFENIQESANIILKKYNSQKKSIDALVYEGIQLKKLAYYKTDILGNIDSSKVLRIYDYYKLMGYTKNPIDMSEFIFQNRKLNIYPKLKNLLTSKEIEWIKEHPSIKVSNEMDYAPFNFVVEGIPKGYSIDLINLLANLIDIKVDYINGYTWDELINLFKNQELDLLHSITKTAAREKFGLFSLPYIRYKTYIYTTNTNHHIKTIKDLFGKTVAVGKGWSVSNFLAQHYPQIKLLEVNNVQEMVYSVSTGKADALINDKYSTLYDIKQQEVENVVQAGWFKEFDNNGLRSYHFMAQQNAPELVSILNKALTILSDTQLQELKESWFGEKTNQQLLTLNQMELDYLHQKKGINLCIDPAWMPFEAVDKQGNYIGISSDYFKYFDSILPSEFNVVKTDTWQQSLAFAKEKKCDILPLAMPTPERQEYMNFTTPYLKVPIVIATKLEVPFIDNLQLLKDKTIAIPKGYAFIDILKEKYPNIHIIEVETIAQGLKQVIQEKVFGYIGTLPSIGYMFQTKFNGELKIAGKFDEDWELGVAVRNDDPILLAIMQKAVNSLSEKQKQEILNTWISIKYEKGTDYTLLWKILAVFIVVVVITILYIRRLQSLKETILKRHENLEKFINTQENIVILTDGKKLHFANKSFFDFLGYEDLNHFKENFNCICDKFVGNNQFFHTGKIDKKENWIKELEKLQHSERIVGILRYDFVIHAFAVTINKFDDDVYIVSFTNITQTMLSHIELLDKSIRDKLTNAYNREYLEKNHQTIIQKTKDANLLLGVAFLDIDYFKLVNDTYGHDIGDKVLIHFVNTIHKFSRDMDILIRWGGEEFILLLKVKTQNDLHQALEHLRRVIEIQEFPIVGQKTCSIGGTLYHFDEELEEAIKRADIGVYEAKEKGRNLVIIKE